MLSRSILITISLLLAACSGVPNSQAIFMDSFPRGDAEEIFAAGFRNIRDKYIEEVSIDKLVIEGLKGLSSIDTAISVTQTGKQIILRRSGEPVASFLAPSSDDIGGWAYIAAQLTSESRKYSSDLMYASEEELYEVVFDGTLSTLDIYSRYAGYSEADRNRAKRDGFGGIGIHFKIDGNTVIITKVLNNTPAQFAGLHTDDVLLSIEGNPVSSLRSTEIAQALRGPVGSKIQLTVECNQRGILELEIERKYIIAETVTEKYQNNILNLTIKSFNHDTADSVSRKLDQAFQREGENLKGVILDLRGNPGGLLKQSIQMADTFLTRGIILDTRGRHVDSLQHYEAGGDDKARGLPVVVLVDGGSASASEIVAAALQDTERAVILGTVSYGKGTVQTVIRLPNNGELILTWSRFITPSGYALHGLGVLPVICTSGISDRASKNLLNSLERHSEQLDTRTLWRQISINNTAGRNKLRSNCPPEFHTGDKDLDLAQMLIEDSVLYHRALELASATAEVIE